jgi:hypothetical protein
MPHIVPNRSSIVKRNPYPLKHVIHSPRHDVSHWWQTPCWKIPRKTMTVCAGLIGKDGLLLTADTEMTYGDGKYDAAKIRRLKFPAGEYVITGAGNTSFIGMASDMIAGKLRRNRARFIGSLERQKELFHSFVQGEILSIHERYIVPQSSQPNVPWFTLILGVQFDDYWNEPFLLHCGGDGGVYWANSDLVEGSGRDIARRFLTILCRDALPLDILRSVAIFCLYQAKQGAAGVGGATHSFIFPAPKMNTIWAETTLVREAEEALRLALVEARDRSVSLPDFKEKANDFVQKLIAIREDVEHVAESQGFVLEMIRKQKASSANAPEPPPAQSGGAAPGSGS